MSETPEQQHAGVPAGGDERARAPEGAADPENPAARAEAAQQARAEGDPRPASQIEAENLAAAEEPRVITQPDVPAATARAAEAESAARYGEAGIAGAPGSETVPGAAGGITPPLAHHPLSEPGEPVTGTGESRADVAAEGGAEQQHEGGF